MHDRGAERVLMTYGLMVFFALLFSARDLVLLLDYLRSYSHSSEDEASYMKLHLR